MSKDFELATPNSRGNQPFTPRQVPPGSLLPSRSPRQRSSVVVEGPLDQNQLLLSVHAFDDENKDDDDRMDEAEPTAVLYPTTGYDRPEVVMIHEIVPTLEKHVILEILKGNQFDLEKSTDAALALVVSLSAEQGLPILNADRNDERKSPMNRQTSRSIYSPGLTRAPTQSHGPSYLSQRGLPVLLSDLFLSSPRFRLVVDRQTEMATDFTIAFRRQGEKLGITIQALHGDICIHSLHRKDSSPNAAPYLAMEAGVKIGDILTGINSEFFSPDAEVQDVIDILHAAGNYVTLHFTRRHKPEDPAVSPYHKCAQMLLDQQIITTERAQYVTKALYRLKDRVLQWDSGWITQRVSSQAAYSNFGGGSSTSSNSSSSSGGGGGGSSGGDSSGGGLLGQSASFGSMLWKATQPAVAPASPECTRKGSLGGGGGDLVISTKNLRPALSVRLLRAEERRDHMIYVIWVMDIRSGAEWVVNRRFREFYVFRDEIAKIRPSIARLEFPPKRLNVTETFAMITERQNLLQKFLRRISSLVCVNSLHPSTARVQMALQKFLYVGERIDTIVLLENRPRAFVKNMVQVFVHSVMQMSVMDRVLSGFIDNYMEDSDECEVKEYSLAEAQTILHSLRDFMDNLQSVMFEGICEDCMAIIARLESMSQHGSNESIAAAAMRDRAAARHAGTVSGSGTGTGTGTSTGSSTGAGSGSGVGKGNWNKGGASSENGAESYAGSTGSEAERSWSTTTTPARGGGGDVELEEKMSGSGSGSRGAQTINGSGSSGNGPSPGQTLGLGLHLDRLERGNLSGEFNEAGGLVVTPGVHDLTDAQKREITIARCTEDEMRAKARSAVRRQVEIEICVACTSRMRAILEKAHRSSQEELNRKIRGVAHLPQSFFGVPIQHISPSSWESVVHMLRELRQHTLPHDRLEALADVAKAVPKLFQKEHPEAEKPLGADEFLPIFIYILVRAQVPHILAFNEELQALCDPDKRLSETGYYLATLEASLQHILEADIESGSLFPSGFGMSSDSFSDSESDGDEPDPSRKSDSASAVGIDSVADGGSGQGASCYRNELMICSSEGGGGDDINSIAATYSVVGDGGERTVGEGSVGSEVSTSSVPPTRLGSDSESMSHNLLVLNATITAAAAETSNTPLRTPEFTERRRQGRRPSDGTDLGPVRRKSIDGSGGVDNDNDEKSDSCSSIDSDSEDIDWESWKFDASTPAVDVDKERVTSGVELEILPYKFVGSGLELGSTSEGIAVALLHDPHDGNEDKSVVSSLGLESTSFDES